jgi:hypothetical protein
LQIAEEWSENKNCNDFVLYSFVFIRMDQILDFLRKIMPWRLLGVYGRITIHR